MFVFIYLAVHEENKKNGRISREETLEMLRAGDSESEESDIFDAISDR